MAEEITLEQLDALAPGSCLLLDVRDEMAFSHGALPGAARLGMEELRAGDFTLPRGRPVVAYCMWGILSAEAAEILADAGWDARSLAGGYAGWLRREMARQQADETRCAEIELGLRRRWRRELFTPFAQAICRYDLLKEGDRVAVCISGGKDSMISHKLREILAIADTITVLRDGATICSLDTRANPVTEPEIIRHMATARAKGICFPCTPF